MSEQPIDQPNDPSLKQPISIVLIEDNPTDAELTIRALRRGRIGNNIQLLQDGAEALDFLFCRGEYTHRSMRNQPKVILLDLKLPRVSGLEVLRELKSDPRTHK